MNHSRHLVSWYGAVGVGGVLHTINPRLFDEQLIYIANHAEDQVLLYDARPSSRRSTGCATNGPASNIISATIRQAVRAV
jgi:acyl-CoA synthetase (AMP-forming)/AMP-acid ligase II